MKYLRINIENMLNYYGNNYSQLFLENFKRSGNSLFSAEALFGLNQVSIIMTWQCFLDLNLCLKSRGSSVIPFGSKICNQIMILIFMLIIYSIYADKLKQLEILLINDKSMNNLEDLNKSLNTYNIVATLLNYKNHKNNPVNNLSEIYSNKIKFNTHFETSLFNNDSIYIECRYSEEVQSKLKLNIIK